MKNQLKCLEDTISEIEREIEHNPHPFLVSTLERLKLYRDNEIDKMVAKIELDRNNNQVRGGFRGFGVS